MENEWFLLESMFGETIYKLSDCYFVLQTSVGSLAVTVPLDFPQTKLSYLATPELTYQPEMPVDTSVFEFLTAFLQQYQAHYSKKTRSKLDIFDSHSHFLQANFEEFGLNFQQVKDNCVGKVCIISPIPDHNLYNLALETANYAPYYFFSVGIHPFYVAREDFNFYTSIKLLQDFASEHRKEAKFVAFGECGFSAAENDVRLLKEYKQNLDAHFQLCEKYGKALIVHAHKPFQLYIVIDEAQKFKRVRGVAHGFGGTPEQAKQLKELGWFGSFNLLTNASQMKKTVKAVGLEFVMLETDSPYSKKGSEPKDVRSVAYRLSEAAGEPIERVVEVCNRNAENLYGIM